MELTCCYESNISINILQKAQKYDQLIKDLSTTRDIVFINLVISSVGMIVKESKSLVDMLLNDNETSAVVRKLINITICSTYWIFCKRNSEQPNPDLLTFKYLILAPLN